MNSTKYTTFFSHHYENMDFHNLFIGTENFTDDETLHMQLHLLTLPYLVEETQRLLNYDNGVIQKITTSLLDYLPIVKGITRDLNKQVDEYFERL